MKKRKYYSNPYQNEIWKANAVEQTQRQRDEIDNAVTGWFIGIFGFVFIAIAIGRLIVYYTK